jgi:hypothetical protein
MDRTEKRSRKVSATERHYTVAEIAKTWQLSQSTVLRMFKTEPGVLQLGNLHARKRTKIYLRIPQSVLDRVHEKRLSKERGSAA